MRKNLKRMISLSLCAAMAVGSLAGCASKKETPAETTTKAAADTTAADTTAASGEETTAGGETADKPFEGVKLKYATTQTASTGEENLKLIELVNV